MPFSAAPGQQCPDVPELEAFLDGLPRGQERAVIRRHLTDCDLCQQRLAEIARNLRAAESLHSVLRRKSAIEADEPQVPERIGSYGIVREIGRGGMGVVYEAEQQNPHRAVAVKVLYGSAGVDKYRIRLFRREAQALARLKHPGIAAIYESGRAEDGQPFLVMELVRGAPLDAYVREKKLTETQRLDLMGRVCNAINYAHQRGVIHLDIKPSNILIDSEGRPKILDFGLARIVDPDATMTTSIADVGKLQGTLPYMSPEQLGGDPGEVDLRSDVYALGVILYELLTGQLPYEIMRTLRYGAARYLHDDQPRKPSSVNRALRGDLETIMLKALEKEPSRRYQSALALAEDIERYGACQPILARPASGLYQLRKLIGRHKLPFAAVAVLAFSVMAFGVWMSALYARAQRADELAQTRLEEVERSRSDLAVVTEFQANMLGDVDAQQLGYKVLADLRASVANVLADAETPQTEIDEVLARLDEPLGRVNRTDFGIRLLHENILRRASETVARDFADRPLIEARLRSTIGDVYQRVGDYKRAEPHLVAARQIWDRELGKTHPETLQSAHALGTLYTVQGRFQEAEPLLVKTLAVRRHLLTDEDPDTLESMCELAILYREQARYDEAEELLVEALERSRRAHGAEHQTTLRHSSNLALLYESRGRYAEAEPLLTTALEGTSRSFGEEHLDTLTFMDHLAKLSRLQGRHDKAESLNLKVLEARRKVLGNEHPVTLATMSNLATLYEAQGRLDEAEPLLVEVLRLRRQLLGKEHPATLTTLNDLAVVYKEQGWIDKAVPLQTEALERRRRVLGGGHPSTLRSMTNLAGLYRALGRYDEAEQLYVEALRGLRRVLGDEHPTVLESMNDLAVVYLHLHRLDEAKPLLLEVLETSRRELGDAHPNTLAQLGNLSAVCRMQGRFEEAEPFAAAAAAGARVSLRDENWRKGVYLSLHGWLLKKLERLDEAEVVLLEARRTLELAVGPTHAQTVKATGYLVELYEALDQPTKAAQWQTLLPPDAAPQDVTAAATEPTD